MEQPINQFESQKNSVQFLPIIISVVLTALVVGGGIFWWTNQKQTELNNEIVSLRTQVDQLKGTSDVTPTPTPTPVTQQNLNSIFELSKKEAGTKIYYSEKLGVGFTYLSPVANYTPKITETATKIDLDGQSIEVFTKDPKLTLAEAIKSKFLQGYNSNDVSAGISFPPTNDPDAPWWQNSDKCQQYYSETNAVQYFLMNKDVPGK